MITKKEVTKMSRRIEQLEFGVTCLEDIRRLLKAWQKHLVRERLESSEFGLIVHVIVEDRQPGEEVKLGFQAAQAILLRFRQALEEQGVKFTCNEVIQGILTICRIIRDRDDPQIIGSENEAVKS
jgi:hypothetical protein